MKLLLDECLPRKLKAALRGHDAKTVGESGWSGVKNGALLDLAEQQFDVFVTMDKNLPYQQRLAGRSLAIVVLYARKNTIGALLPLVPQVLAVLSNLKAGDVKTVAA